MADQRQFPPKVYTQLDVLSNWLYAKPLTQGGKRPNLKITINGNVPRISCRPNHPDYNANNGRIDFKTDLYTFSAILSSLRRLAEGKMTETSYRFTFRDNFVAGKKLSDRITLSYVEIGRTKDGRVYMACCSTKEGAPKVPFIFGPAPMNHELLGPGGQPLEERVVSEAYAIAFVEAMLPLVMQLLTTLMDPEARNVAKAPGAPGQGGGNRQGGGYGGQRNGGGGGNYRGNGGGNYGGQQNTAPAATSDFDDFEDF